MTLNEYLIHMQKLNSKYIFFDEPTFPSFEEEKKPKLPKNISSELRILLAQQEFDMHNAIYKKNMATHDEINDFLREVEIETGTPEEPIKFKFELKNT